MALATSRASHLVAIIPPNLRYEIFSNRPIAGTNTPSEHSYGNAIDIFGSPEAMKRFAARLNTERAQYSIATLCYDGEGSPGYDHCTTPHTDHIHVDFSPRCGPAGIPTTGSDSDRSKRCNEYQNNSGGVVGRGTGILDKITDPLTEPIQGVVEGVQRAAIILGGVLIGGIALAIVLGDMKLKGATKVVKGWLK